MKSNATNICLFHDLVQFAKDNSILKFNKSQEASFNSFLEKLSADLFENYSAEGVKGKHNKWKQYFSAFGTESLCFHSSVFEYIFLTLMTITYYKKQINDSKIKELEITILTTQSPESIDEQADNEYNPHFPTASALNSYSSAFREMINSSEGKIRVNRHFLYQNTSIEDKKERVKLVYPKSFFQTCYCTELNSNCEGICSKCTGRQETCIRKRSNFLSQQHTNHFIFDLDILKKSNKQLSNPEIREFIGFKIIENGRSYYKHAYTSNLTDGMTSMFIKMWSYEDLYKTNAKLPFIGIDNGYFFNKFIEEIELNQIEKNNLHSFWGLDNLQPSKGVRKKSKVL